ncbi:DNA-3-methyladenine glycosidase I [gamma proteobacterium HTCC5015]|nr:DNA-3-methyladenine glycosidase I [gamma proteobacterium HTCC5015]
MPRCAWVKHPLDIPYHDEEWGTPCFDESKLFEFLLLEGAQAGLSWITILKKREAYRHAFAQFNPHKIARFNESERTALLDNVGIVRNRLKIDAAIGNAKAWLELLEDGIQPREWLWQFVDGQPRQNNWENFEQIPTQTVESIAMSKALKARGFRFVGPTICYAYMQAMGMVNDHTTDCDRHSECRLLAKTL